MQAEVEIGILQDVLHDRAETYLAGAEFAALSPADQAAVRADLSRSDLAAADAALPAAALHLSPVEAALFQRSFDLIEEQFGVFFVTENELETRAMRVAVRATTTALEGYFASPTVERFRVLRERLDNLRVQTTEIIPFLVAEADEHLGESLVTVARFRQVIIAVTILIAMALLGVTLLVHRQLSRALAEANRDRETAKSASEGLQHRNDQLNALYSVYAEITDTLSLRYVIDAALREALKLMSADSVSLRLLKGNELVVAGSLTASGAEWVGIRRCRWARAWPVGSRSAAAPCGSMTTSKTGSRTTRRIPCVRSLPGPASSSRSSSAPASSGRSAAGHGSRAPSALTTSG